MVFTIVPTMFDDFEDINSFNRFNHLESPMEDIFDMIGQRRYQPYMVLKHSMPENLKRLQHSQHSRKNCGPSDISKSMEEKTNFGMVVAEDNFTVKMDVRDFKPEEIAVKITNDSVLSIEATHEEEDDESGYILRRVMKKFTVPEGFDLEKMASKLTTDGTLTITAPNIRKTENKEEEQHKIIPIEHVTE